MERHLEHELHRASGMELPENSFREHELHRNNSDVFLIFPESFQVLMT